MSSLFRQFVRERRATTSIEYAFIAMLIAMAIVGAITSLRTTLTSSYNSVADGFSK
jgi:Flp pilus assembly pilin Flp